MSNLLPELNKNLTCPAGPSCSYTWNPSDRAVSAIWLPRRAISATSWPASRNWRMQYSVCRSPPRQPRSKFSCRIFMDQALLYLEFQIRHRIQMAEHIDQHRDQGANDCSDHAQPCAMYSAYIERKPHQGSAKALSEYTCSGLHASGRTAAMSGRTSQQGAIVWRLEKPEAHAPQQHGQHKPKESCIYG